MSLRSPPKKPVQAADPGDAAAIRLAAVTLLARRDFAGGELRGKLVDRGFAEEAVAAVLAEMSAAGLFSEARYVESYVTSHANRGQGPARIRADLRKNGVAEALIGPGLEALDWAELARKVRRGKFGAAAAAELGREGTTSTFFAVPGVFSGSYPRGHWCRPRL